MQQINEAYQNNDIQALLDLEHRYLLEELDLESGALSMDVLDGEINRLGKKLDFINKQVQRTSAEIKNIRQSEYGSMLTAVGQAAREGQGVDVLTAHYQQMLELLIKLRDGFKDSLKRKAISPILIELLMGSAFPGFHNIEDLFSDDLDEEDLFDIFNEAFSNKSSGEKQYRAVKKSKISSKLLC